MTKTTKSLKMAKTTKSAETRDLIIASISRGDYSFLADTDHQEIQAMIQYQLRSVKYVEWRTNAAAVLADKLTAIPEGEAFDATRSYWTKVFDYCTANAVGFASK